MEFRKYLAKDFCLSVRDGTHDSPKQKESGYKLITSKHISNNKLDLESAYYISESAYKKINERSLVEKNDILFSMIGTIGNVYRVEDVPNYAIKNMGLFKLNDELRSKWLYYLLNSNIISNYIQKMMAGSTQNYITLESLRNLPVMYPAKEKDALKIVEILSGIDKKIELNTKINDNLDKIATIYFEKWKYQCTKSVIIGEIAENILDYSKNYNDKVRLINSGDVTDGLFIKSELVENKELKGHFKKKFEKNDILYSEIRPRNHHFGYVLFDPKDYIASTRLMVIRNQKDKISSSILYYYLKSKDVLDKFTMMTESRSGTFPQGKYDDMSKIEIPYETKDKQLNLTEMLDTILLKIYRNNYENETLIELRDILLPKLMSGEVELDNVEV